MVLLNYSVVVDPKTVVLYAELADLIDQPFVLCFEMFVKIVGFFAELPSSFGVCRSSCRCFLRTSFRFGRSPLRASLNPGDNDRGDDSQ